MAQNPFGIAQVDIPGLLGLHSNMRRQRLADLATQRELEMQQKQLDREEKKAAVRARILKGGGQSTPENMPTRPTPAPVPTGVSTEALSPDSDEIVVSAAPRPARPQIDQGALFEYAVLDPEAAQKIFEFSQKAEEADLTRYKSGLDFQERAARAILSLPEPERQAAYEQLLPEIQERFPDARLPEEWDDSFGEYALNLAIDAKAALERADKDRAHALNVEEFGETKRHNQVSEGLTRRGQDVTVRGQDMARGNTLISAQSGQVVDTADGPMLVDRRTGQARPVTMGGSRVPGEAAQKRAKGAARVLDLLSEAEGLLDDATGSYAGWTADQAARVIGRSTEGSRAIARLRAIEGALLAEMPRMEGPQSNMDVQMYRQAAGALADPTIPAADKRAALQTIQQIQSRYVGGQSRPPVARSGADDPLGIR